MGKAVGYSACFSGSVMHTAAPRILVVDDNEDNRYTLDLFLRGDGHEAVATASGGREALATIEREQFSLVLLDIMMPDLSGEEVLTILKSNPQTRDIPIIVISADSEHDRVSRCIELGADDYIPKPFKPAILRARVASAL